MILLVRGSRHRDIISKESALKSRYLCTSGEWSNGSACFNGLYKFVEDDRMCPKAEGMDIEAHDFRKEMRVIANAMHRMKKEGQGNVFSSQQWW